MSDVTLFGAEFSKQYALGCRALGIELPWGLAVLALESGFNPHAQNASGARGLFQKMPEQVLARTHQPVILPPDAVAPPGFLVKDEHGDKTDMKKVTGRTLWKLYTCPSPAQQIEDAFRFWSAMKETFHVGEFSSRGAFYALNLAPARLARGTEPERVLYSSRKDLHPEEYWPAAYEANKGLDPLLADGKTRKGWIEIRDLEAPLDKAIARCKAKYDAELAAAKPYPVSELAAAQMMTPTLPSPSEASDADELE